MNAREREAKSLFISNLSFYAKGEFKSCPFFPPDRSYSATEYRKAFEDMYFAAERVVAGKTWWMKWAVIPVYHFCLKVWR